MAEDTKGYITYGKEQGISESKAKEYWEKASKEVKEETGKTKEELTDKDWQHIMGVYKKIITNSKKQESVEIITTTKNYIIEGNIINNNSKMILDETEQLLESISDSELNKLVNKYNIDFNYDNTTIIDSYVDKHGIVTSTYKSKGNKPNYLLVSRYHDRTEYIEVDVSAIRGMVYETSIGEYPINKKFHIGDTFQIKWPIWDNKTVDCKIMNINYDGLGYDEVTYEYDVYISSITSRGKTGFNEIEDDADSLSEQELIKLIV
jgi:hypothetical protein